MVLLKDLSSQVRQGSVGVVSECARRRFSVGLEKRQKDEEEIVEAFQMRFAQSGATLVKVRGR